jgi:hypothetical protein
MLKKQISKQQILSLGENGTIDSWYQYYESQLKIFRSNYFNGQLELYERFLEKRFQEVEAWSTPKREYYKFHCCLYTMQKIENNYSIWSSSYYYNSKSHFRNRTIKFLDILVNTIANVANGEDELIGMLNKDAINKLRELMLRNTESHFDWLNIYTGFWTNVFKDPLLITDEIQILENQLLVRGTKSTNRYNWQIAQAHFQFLKGKEAIALQQLLKVNVKLNEIIGYLKIFYDRQELGSLEKWLEASQNLLGAADEEEFREVTMFWLAVAKFKEDYQDCLKMLSRYLPKSNILYEEVLIKAGQWKNWVDFHLFNESTPNSINPNNLIKIEGVDMTLLLPLYHQYVSRLLQEKNRGAYKEAVRFLKKLRTYYKKLDRIDYWEQFIESLALRNIRLRAFQEELRNGKLLI